MNQQQRAVVQQALEMANATMHEALEHIAKLKEENAALRQLLEQPEPVQEPVAVTDAMALAFHRAISDGSIGESDLKEIKAGLSAAFAHITTPPAQPAVPTQCWKCGDMDAMGHAKCDVPACGMKQRLEQEHGHALERALTRLQKRYAELEAKVAAQPAAWVGLTLEERAKIADVSDDFEDVVDATEAKLREKKGGAA